MTVVLSIIIMLFAFSVLAIVHEWGHFIAARIFKVTVVEFSVFMGPKIWQRKSKKTGTKFTIRALPLGGFCSFEDDIKKETDGGKTEEEKEPETISPTSLMAQKWWKRLIIYSAGVFMNIVLAVIIAAIIICVEGFSTSRVDYVNNGSLAQIIGIEEGDKLVNYNGIKVNNYTDCQVAEFGIKDKNPDELIMDSHYTIKYKKASGKTASYDVTKHLTENKTEDGTIIDSWKYIIVRNFDNKDTVYEYSAKLLEIDEEKQVLKCSVSLYEDGKLVKEGDEDIVPENFAAIGNNYYRVDTSKNPFKLIKYAFIDTVSWVKSVYISLYWLVIGDIGVEALSGPIGVTTVVNDVVSISGVSSFLKIAALLYLVGMISANLAVMNFLPFPGLDGFYVLLVAFELVTGGKKLPTKVQNILSYIGLGLLILLAVFVAFSDIRKIVGV